MRLIRLIYTSTPADGVDIHEVQKILDRARSHNQGTRITGYLTFRDSFFVQVLEGERQSVTELFGRICADDRHEGVELVSSEPIAERIFGEWAMGYACLSDEGRDSMSRHGADADADPRDLEPKNLLRWMQEIAAREPV